MHILLNIIKGPTSYEDIRTINSITYPKFKDACHALSLLDLDKKWNECLTEVGCWATGLQMRVLFITMLLYYQVSDPL